jgi:ubiquinone/menaquinone biosynthesis C-methylase UbiE
MAGSGEDAAARGTYGPGMHRRSAPRPLILQAAALARIEEMVASQGMRGGRADQVEGSESMTAHQTSSATADLGTDRGVKAQQRAMWALGDYHRFATQTVWGFGPVLVEACAICAGQRVLDVAAGSGNVAIRAAEAGARVVASDLTPENFEAGRREAGARGVQLEWVQADAESLPFDDGEFDVVTSSVGAIFAPDHQAVADELLRVCRPGGTIGMINFTPEGLAAEFFELFGRHAPPPPPGALPPVLWGSEEHVRELFGDRLASLELTRREYVERSPGDPAAYCELFKQTFGPVVGLYASLADRPRRLAALDRDFLGFATRSNQGPTDGAAEYHYEYLLVVGRTRESRSGPPNRPRGAVASASRARRERLARGSHPLSRGGPIDAGN